MTTATRPAVRGTGASTLRTPARAMAIVLFASYLAMLAWIVLWKLERPWIGDDLERVIKLVPFADTSEFGASAPREVFANVALFVPFGVYLGMLVPTWRWRSVTAIAAATSLALETVQYALAVGSADSTDVIANAAGALTGVALLALARRRFGERTTAVILRLGALGTLIGLLAGLIVAVAPLGYGPQHGRPGDRPGVVSGGVSGAADPMSSQAVDQARVVPNASPSR